MGYSDFQAKVSEVQSRALDEAIQMIQTHPEFRYSPDGYWCAEEFLAGRTPAQRARFLELVKEKKIFIPPQEASLLTGFASLEVLIRSLYGGFQFNQKYGGSFDYANITDVPSYSWSYASILADAGLKYFAAASDNDNGPILLNSRLNEKSPFWWEGPDGEKILMWYARCYFQVASFVWIAALPAGGPRLSPDFPATFFPPRLQVGRGSALRHAGGEHRPLSAGGGSGGKLESAVRLPEDAVFRLRRSAGRTLPGNWVTRFPPCAATAGPIGNSAMLPTPVTWRWNEPTSSAPFRRRNSRPSAP